MLGEILQHARRAKHLSQETVAARARLTREYISMVERNVNSPTVDTLLRICRAIGISASDAIRELERPANDIIRRRK